MSNERLDRHSQVFHELFDENTAQVGSLGDVVEHHAGDTLFLGPAEHTPGGVDSGLSDFQAEELESDPAENAGADANDLFSQAGSGIWATDQTGTVAGIARGFGTHLPQDLGKGGFQVEELPEAALTSRVALRDGEELDDYDDEDDTNGKFDDGDLAFLSEPNAIELDDTKAEPTPDRIHIRPVHPSNADDQFDATRLIQ